MKKLPILFSTIMVKAILENRKTMTRRLVKYNKIIQNPEVGFSAFCNNDNFEVRGIHENGEYGSSLFKLKYAVGDILWVREAHRITWDDSYWVCEFKDGVVMRKYYKNISLKTNNRLIKRKRTGKWVNSMFLPREFSRIYLQITKIRCERLQDITEADALAEGVDFHMGLALCSNPERNLCNESIRESFFLLWEYLNGKDSVKLNPWVFVYEFKRIEK